MKYIRTKKRASRPSSQLEAAEKSSVWKKLKGAWKNKKNKPVKEINSLRKSWER